MGTLEALRKYLSLIDYWEDRLEKVKDLTIDEANAFIPLYNIVCRPDDKMITFVGEGIGTVSPEQLERINKGLEEMKVHRQKYAVFFMTQAEREKYLADHEQLKNEKPFDALYTTTSDIYNYVESNKTEVRSDEKLDDAENGLLAALLDLETSEIDEGDTSPLYLYCLNRKLLELVEQDLEAEFQDALDQSVEEAVIDHIFDNERFYRDMFDDPPITRTGEEDLGDTKAIAKNPLLVFAVEQGTEGSKIYPIQRFLQEHPELYRQLQIAIPGAFSRNDSPGEEDPKNLQFRKNTLRAILSQTRAGYKFAGILFDEIVQADESQMPQRYTAWKRERAERARGQSEAAIQRQAGFIDKLRAGNDDITIGNLESVLLAYIELNESRALEQRNQDILKREAGLRAIIKNTGVPILAGYFGTTREQFETQYEAGSDKYLKYIARMVGSVYFQYHMRGNAKEALTYFDRLKRQDSKLLQDPIVCSLYEALKNVDKTRARKASHACRRIR